MVSFMMTEDSRVRPLRATGASGKTEGKVVTLPQVTTKFETERRKGVRNDVRP